MAVTVTVFPQGSGQKSYRSWKLGNGLTVAQVELTMTENTDYVTGSTTNFTIASGIQMGVTAAGSALAAKMGFRKIFGVVVQSIRNTTGSTADGTQGHKCFVTQFDATTDCLRLFQQNATSGELLEVVAGGTAKFAPITNPVLISMLVFGV